MSQVAVTIHDPVLPASQEIQSPENEADAVPGVLAETDVSLPVPAVIIQKANPVDLFGAAQFASDECGDSMWNEENLNPPSQK